MTSFTISNTCGKARTGKLLTSHGEVLTPVFMPVGTAGSIKGVTPDQVRAAGVQIVLGNTYHLTLRPGEQTVCDLGGLHRMMGWNGPILTDSGGYQVFSLGHLRKIDSQGVIFRSHIDGSEVSLTPQRVIEIQRLLGADIIMQLDECPPHSATKTQISLAVERSAEWAIQCKTAWTAADCRSAAGEAQALFGIQQGGLFEDLRAESAQRLVTLDLPGYAIGGLSVGEGHDGMCAVLDRIDSQFPHDRPRYLMGVGEPKDILAAVARGVDMFDCVLPTRNGRNAQAFTWSGRLRLRNARWATDDRPLHELCTCYTCRNFSRGALRHLFGAGEMLGPTLVSIHNLQFFCELMGCIREAIQEGNLETSAAKWLAEIYPDEELDNGEQ